MVAIAVESDEADVRRMAAKLDLPFAWAMGTPEQARAFGDVSAVPMLLLFDRAGRTAASFYGAPPGPPRGGRGEARRARPRLINPSRHLFATQSPGN